MARSNIVRLREDPDAAPPSAVIIDVEFKVVDKARRTSVTMLWTVMAVAVAALLGLLAPPLFRRARGLGALSCSPLMGELSGRAAD